LNSDHEEITFLEASSGVEVSPQLDIKTSINKDGVEMVGYDSIDNYLHILRSLVYINRKPAYYLNRVFKLSCSQLGDRFQSADYTFTLTVLHPKQPTSTENSISSEKVIVSIHEHDNSNIFNRILLHPQEVSEPHSRTSNNVNHNNGSTHSTMLILVICVSFVLLICGVGVARLRNQKQISKGKRNHLTCSKVRT
jgi:calsyntenin 1